MSHDFFLQCLREAAANKELVAEFDRLNGSMSWLLEELDKEGK